MDIYFIRAFIKDNYIGLNNIHSVIDHFSRDGKSLANLIFVIIKACISLEEFTLQVRLKGLNSPFVYGLSERDIDNLEEEEQIQLLQHYCNIYVLLYHLCQLTLDISNSDYKEHIDKELLFQQDKEVIDYVQRANRQISDKWNRTVF